MLIRILSEFKDVVILERGLRASCNSFMWRMVSRKSVHLFKGKLAIVQIGYYYYYHYFLYLKFSTVCRRPGSGKQTKIDDCCI